jgi:predicted dehydrogenase
MMAAPIQVGFIGLSSQGWGLSAHIPYLIASPKLKIVAICNTSVASAAASIEQNKLGPETKAYGNPQGGSIIVFRRIERVYA